MTLHALHCGVWPGMGEVRDTLGQKRMLEQCGGRASFCRLVVPGGIVVRSVG